MYNTIGQYMRDIPYMGHPIQINIIYCPWCHYRRLCNFRLQSYYFFLIYANKNEKLTQICDKSEKRSMKKLASLNEADGEGAEAVKSWFADR